MFLFLQPRREEILRDVASLQAEAELAFLIQLLLSEIPFGVSSLRERSRVKSGFVIPRTTARSTITETTR